MKTTPRIRSLSLLLPLILFATIGVNHAAPPKTERFVSKMEKELNLSKDQSSKIRAILAKDSGSGMREGHGKKGGGCRGCGHCGGKGWGVSPMSGLGEFARQRRSAVVDTEALNKTFDERQSRMREMHAGRVAKFVEIHAVLTPEQRAKAADHADKRLAKAEKKCAKKCGKKCAN
jgi:Spy/CpxP family protein refolding chaperone